MWYSGRMTKDDNVNTIADLANQADALMSAHDVKSASEVMIAVYDEQSRRRRGTPCTAAEFERLADMFEEMAGYLRDASRARLAVEHMAVKLS